MKRILILITLISCTHHNNPIANADAVISKETAIVDSTAAANVKPNPPSGISSDIFKTMDSLKVANIKAVQHIYMNAWIDGANAIISAQSRWVLSNSYLTKQSKKDSSFFSDDFLRRNHVTIDQLK